jgi:hypothetical protein
MEDLLKELVQFLPSEDGLSLTPTLTNVKDIVIPYLNLHGLHAKYESIIETPQLLCLFFKHMDSLTSHYLFDSQVDLFKNIDPNSRTLPPIQEHFLYFLFAFNVHSAFRNYSWMKKSDYQLK